MGADLFVVICIWLATWRLTRLIITDQITAPLREPLQEYLEVRWLRKHPRRVSDPVEWLSPGAYLLACPWCMSMWVGAAVTAGTWPLHRFPVPILVAIAASGITGMLAAIEQAIEGDDG